MTHDPFQYYRRSLRQRKYSFSRGGIHFVTICTHNRECMLGEVVESEMRLNEYGTIAREEWLHTEVARPNVLIDEFIIMPNHIHAIIVLTGGLLGEKRRGTTSSYGSAAGRPEAQVPDSIDGVMQQFRRNTTRRINSMRSTPGALVWQDDQYERAIRNAYTLERLRGHIADNPATWDRDENNPASRHAPTD
jgi:REP element-mobilizing transposase RayT